MKQLARIADNWPGIDKDIHDLCKTCDPYCEHRNPSKAPVHPWMFPEKPWNRIHIDHAIMGSDWLIIVDAFSKYPCIHSTKTTSTKPTIELIPLISQRFGEILRFSHSESTFVACKRK
ncbi:hypothetical protein RRG08_004487 [Elysia crispata]|uniref:Integrase zinc-binding domain-containing protein n=1 Tax=Elysia crispata TaxID=231223 RepID=A0AAE1BBK9_9GAST|nr:hypothetical protein RRG08_004487 [Elysia crispata]